jgi:uncharacterized low-complexity protein
MKKKTISLAAIMLGLSAGIAANAIEEQKGFFGISETTSFSAGPVAANDHECGDDHHCGGENHCGDDHECGEGKCGH